MIQELIVHIDATSPLNTDVMNVQDCITSSMMSKKNVKVKEVHIYSNYLQTMKKSRSVIGKYYPNVVFHFKTDKDIAMKALIDYVTIEMKYDFISNTQTTATFKKYRYHSQI